jgi:hypothetical protein
MWLLEMYNMISSKGISVIILAKWISVSQKSLETGHEVCKMMHPSAEIPPVFSGMVEVDEK